MGGELVLSPNESIRIKSFNGNYIGILKGNSRFTLVDYYDNDTGEYNGFGIELDGQGDGSIRLGGEIECNSVRILNLYITTREGDLELNVDKAKELGILS